MSAAVHRRVPAPCKATMVPSTPSGTMSIGSYCRVRFPDREYRTDTLTPAQDAWTALYGKLQLPTEETKVLLLILSPRWALKATPLLLKSDN